MRRWVTSRSAASASTAIVAASSRGMSSWVRGSGSVASRRIARWLSISLVAAAMIASTSPVNWSAPIRDWSAKSSSSRSCFQSASPGIDGVAPRRSTACFRALRAVRVLSRSSTPVATRFASGRLAHLSALERVERHARDCVAREHRDVRPRRRHGEVRRRGGPARAVALRELEAAVAAAGAAVVPVAPVVEAGARREVRVDLGPHAPRKRRESSCWYFGSWTCMPQLAIGSFRRSSIESNVAASSSADQPVAPAVVARRPRKVSCALRHVDPPSSLPRQRKTRRPRAARLGDRLPAPVEGRVAEEL